VEYLDYIVSHEGVKLDLNKIKAMREWEIHKFVKNYGQIETPLTKLLNKEAFSWTKEAAKAFQKLKNVICTTLIWKPSDFTKPFIVECDASSHDIGEILMHEGRQHDSESSKLKVNNLLRPIYEKQMLGKLHVRKKWCPYQIGRHFKVKTDHDSLKYFLEH